MKRSSQRVRLPLSRSALVCAENDPAITCEISALRTRRARVTLPVRVTSLRPDNGRAPCVPRCLKREKRPAAGSASSARKDVQPEENTMTMCKNQHNYTWCYYVGERAPHPQTITSRKPNRAGTGRKILSALRVEPNG